ncbi:DUF3256 family protein [Prevotella melaninogenica]|uniref:DUF3256 family protein n=1 Tax=Prevotella melaninogenica TaxID=28132 RepID=UPI001C6018A6|nr:DUF3256 family protein [Prevotella melaninogenica]MBW4741135.1 DUF3256 family protein [Prevotella melaninogenica]MBW4911853.1 DUF3256 family protein [Prevotella melaninogenica]
MKKILIIICFLTCWLGVSAQSLREVWIEMPDSILPYLSKSQRTELADYVEMKAEPAVLSTFGDSVRIERMTNNYLLLKANEATRLEIKLLDNNTLALVQTWMAPAAESKLRLFNLQWQPKEAVVDYKVNIVKPDSMSDEDFADLKTLMSPRLKEYRLSADNNSLSVSWNYPLLSKKDVKRVTELLKSQVLNWTGKDFR